MISFTVKGIPIPQGSMSAFVLKTCNACGGGRRAIVTSANAKLKKWRSTVRTEALAAMGFEHPAGKNVPIRIQAVFFLPRAKSNKAFDAVKKPDLDKLVRALLDGMSEVVFEDDSQVTELHCFKTYGAPRVEIRVEEVGILTAPVKHEFLTDVEIPF